MRADGEAAVVKLRLLFADAGFAAATGVGEGFPLMHWADGSLAEPVFAYYAWLCASNRMAISSMKPNSYDLRAWLAYCGCRGRAWEAPDDDLLEEWRAELLDGGGGPGLGPARVERKIGVVFSFYRFLHVAHPIDERGRRRTSMVVAEGAEGAETGGVLTSKKVATATRWSRAGATWERQSMRPVPDAYQVREVLTRVRTVRENDCTVEGRNRMGTLLADRNWAAARCMSGAGLRSGETAKLTLQHVLKMLAAEGLPLPAAAGGGVHPLDALASDAVSRAALMDGINALEAAHRTTFHLDILGKGRKWRRVPVGIDLVRDILEVAVFSVRARQLEELRSLGDHAPPPDWLFLSERGGHLKPGSLGDILKGAFDMEPRIPGSAHRLRAHFATETAIRIFSECLASTGGVYTGDTAALACARLADALGHADWSTTIRFYVDLARMHHASATARAGAHAAALWSELSRSPGRLSKTKAATLRKVILAVTDADDESELCRLMELAAGRPDLRRAA